MDAVRSIRDKVERGCYEKNPDMVFSPLDDRDLIAIIRSATPTQVGPGRFVFESEDWKVVVEDGDRPYVSAEWRK
jgi:hypothetical protein